MSRKKINGLFISVGVYFLLLLWNSGIVHAQIKFEGSDIPVQKFCNSSSVTNAQFDPATGNLILNYQAETSNGQVLPESIEIDKVGGSDIANVPSSTITLPTTGQIGSFNVIYNLSPGNQLFEALKSRFKSGQSQSGDTQKVNLEYLEKYSDGNKPNNTGTCPEEKKEVTISYLAQAQTQDPTKTQQQTQENPNVGNANALPGSNNINQCDSNNPLAPNACSTAGGLVCNPKNGEIFTPDAKSRKFFEFRSRSTIDFGRATKNILTNTALGGPPTDMVNRANNTNVSEINRQRDEQASKALKEYTSSNYPGVMTAIGCVPTEPKALVEGILKFTAAGIGAIALLLMVLGAFTMITSDGNPETIQKGKDQFTAALLGTLFIIFSVLLLQVIGVDILGLPQFGK